LESNHCHIVSGSGDSTIRVWNATTGQCIAGPYQGHTHNVTSVAYSPDGKSIVSGSWDNTIRIWNPVTGQCIAGPFQGHTGGVSSVAYFPDSTHIVSGSWDKTIRIWNATTGQCIAGPFLGHTDAVKSVSYSPDGYIVSGSSDKTIRLWNDPITVSTSPGLDSSGEIYQQEDGWMELFNGACLCWIPSWGRNACYLPIHTLVISGRQTYQPDFTNFLYGESWVSCWK